VTPEPADLRFRLGLGLVGLAAVAVFLVAALVQGQAGIVIFEALAIGGAFSGFLTWDSWRKLRRSGRGDGGTGC
jgi:hypothetical protein